MTDLVERILKRTGYAAQIVAGTTDASVRERKLGNLKELGSSASCQGMIVDRRTYLRKKYESQLEELQAVLTAASIAP